MSDGPNDIASVKALALQPGDPALAELVAAREGLERALFAMMAERKAAGEKMQAGPEYYRSIDEWDRAVERLDAARRKLGGGQSPPTTA